MAEQPKRRWLRRGLITAALIVGTVFLIEMGTASAAEYRLSRELRASAALSTDPTVVIGSVPYLMSGGDHRTLNVSVPALIGSTNIDETGRIEAELSGVETAPGIVPTFTSTTPIHVTQIESRVRLTQATFGRYLGIVDLQVHTPAPKRAGAGSPADGYVRSPTGVILTGTVELPTAAEPDRAVLISVSADFSADGDSIRVQATAIYDGPEDHASAALLPGEEPTVLAAFSRTLPPMRLPFGIRPTGAQGENADVVLLGVATNITVTPGQFYPPTPAPAAAP